MKVMQASILIGVVSVGGYCIGKTPITFVSGNPGKIKEVKEILQHIPVQTTDIDLPEIQSIDPKEVITAKLEQAFKEGAKGPLMVEDTSLMLDGLHAQTGEGGLPGPLIKWFGKTALKWGLLPRLANAIGNNKATAVSYIGYATSPEDIVFFKGEIKGCIVPARGTLGFGWDLVFQPDGHQKTFGQMSLEEKNELSMRKRALEKLKEYLLTH